MQVHNITQGTDQWRAHRAKYLNASDAPAMMACSPNMSRTDLVRQLALGIERDFSDYVQNHILDKGHLFEKLARPMAEKIMGEELAPLVGTSGKYGASFDGQILLGTRSWEHKRLNAALREAMFEGCTGADLPLCYQVQMEHQAMVAEDTEQILFTASEWDDDGNIIEARHCWYTPNPELRAQIVAGWAQLEADVAAYVQPEPKPAPVVAAPMETLPAVSVRVDGQLAIVSNLPAFGTALRNFIDRIPTAPSTDQEFADTEAACKALKQTEDALEAAESNALAQLADVDTMRRFVADYRALARATRLQREKLVAQRKEEIRGEIAASGVAALREHIAALNARLGKPYMPTVPADFAGVIKGKRTVDSLRSAVNDELARAKIAANEIADRIHVNLTTLREQASAHAFLFADTAQIVLKQPDDLAVLVKSRIGDHEAKEAARIEAERARIRQEEAERADREAHARLEQQERERQAEIEQARKDQALPAPLLDDLSSVATHVRDTGVAEIGARQAIAAAQGAAPASAGIALAPASAQEPADDGPATLLIGGINRRLGYDVNAAFLKQLGFEPVRADGARRFYRDADLPRIGRAIAEHTLRVTQLQTA